MLRGQQDRSRGLWFSFQLRWGIKKPKRDVNETSSLDKVVILSRDPRCALKNKCGLSAKLLHWISVSQQSGS